MAKTDIRIRDAKTSKSFFSVFLCLNVRKPGVSKKAKLKIFPLALRKRESMSERAVAGKEIEIWKILPMP